MALKAVKPEAIQKRLKLFLYGPAGVGKSTAAIQFPNSYIVDTERGVENYAELINASGSAVLQTNQMEEIVSEVRTLLTEKHDYRTLIIDPITTTYNDLLDQCEAKVGSEFGRHYGAANKTMRRLSNMLTQLDMNVIVTAHAKKEYGAKLEVLGQTFDGWKQLDYLFDLVLELTKRGGKRYARIVKTRYKEFPDGESFEWSYQEFEARYGADNLARKANAVALATPAQVKELRGLLEVVRIDAEITDKWLSKAGVDSFEDMPGDTIAKCISFLAAKLPKIVA